MRPSRKAACTGRTEGADFFIDPSIGLCRLAEQLRDGPASFALSSLLPQSIVEVASGSKAAKSLHLEDMAAPLAELIKSQQTSGPCVLVGYCWGGTLAFEVAHQIQQDGGRVDMVVLLDSWQTAPSIWQKLKILSPARLLPSVKWHLGSLWQNRRRLAKRDLGASSSTSALTPLGDGGTVPTRVLIPIFRIIRSQYRYRPLKARGLLVRAGDERRLQLGIRDATLGWGRFFPHGLEVVDVPCDHISMLAEPNIPTLSRVIQESLEALADSAETSEWHEDAEAFCEDSVLAGSQDRASKIG